MTHVSSLLTGCSGHQLRAAYGIVSHPVPTAGINLLNCFWDGLHRHPATFDVDHQILALCPTRCLCTGSRLFGPCLVCCFVNKVKVTFFTTCLLPQQTVI